MLTKNEFIEKYIPKSQREEAIKILCDYDNNMSYFYEDFYNTLKYYYAEQGIV